MGNRKQRVVFLNSPKTLNIAVINDWLLRVADLQGYKIRQLTFDFVSREKIIEINKSHLNHDYATDIITFSYGRKLSVTGEVYICPEVVRDNAFSLGEQNENELNRVVVHGLLHLMGFNDKSAVEQEVMRAKEDECLSMLGDVK